MCIIIIILLSYYCIYIGKYPKLIHVPTHFFKVILGKREVFTTTSTTTTSNGNGDEYQSNSDNIIAVGAFLIPNKKPDGNAWKQSGVSYRLIDIL